MKFTIFNLINYVDEVDIDKLVCFYIHSESVDASYYLPIFKKLSKKTNYKARKEHHYSHLKFYKNTIKDFEKIIWSYYVLCKIDDGLTTKNIAELHNKSLELINSYI
jgi:hypothetical protein